MNNLELYTSDPLCEQYVEIVIELGDTVYGTVKGFYNYGEDHEKIVLLCEGNESRIIATELIDTITILQYEYCTNCGAELYPQEGYKENRSYFQCRKCGQMLIDPEIDNHSDLYDDIVWVCDKCGTILNQQEGFSDYLGEWECTECGYINPINEDEIIDVKHGPLS